MVGIAFLFLVVFLPLPCRRTGFNPHGRAAEDDVGCTGCDGCLSSSLAGCGGDTGGADWAVGADGVVGFVECPGGSSSGSTAIGCSSVSLVAASGADEDEAGA